MGPRRGVRVVGRRRDGLRRSKDAFAQLSAYNSPCPFLPTHAAGLPLASAYSIRPCRRKSRLSPAPTARPSPSLTHAPRNCAHSMQLKKNHKNMAHGRPRCQRARETSSEGANRIRCNPKRDRGSLLLSVAFFRVSAFFPFVPRGAPRNARPAAKKAWIDRVERGSPLGEEGGRRAPPARETTM